nr:hypothetical protein [Tanacetum cinerariifolium]
MEYHMDNSVSEEPSRVMSTSHGIVYSISDILDFNPISINVVSDFFKVSLLTPVDIDNFIRDLDSDKFKVWSMLAKEQRVGVIDIVGVLFDSLLSDDNDITREKPRVEYEWRPPRCDECKIFGHVHDECPKKVVSPSIATTSNVVTSDVTPTIVMPNDGFQTVGKKKKNGKAKSTNVCQFVGPSVKQNFRYEPKAKTSQPKKGATNVGNASNSYSALENEDEEHVENVHEESTNLFPTLKADEISSFSVGAGNGYDKNGTKFEQNRAQNKQHRKVNSHKLTNSQTRQGRSQRNQKLKKKEEEGPKLPFSKVLYKPRWKNDPEKLGVAPDSLREEDYVDASNSHVVSVSSSINTECDSFASHDDIASSSNSSKTPKVVIHREFIDTPGESVYLVPRVFASVLPVLGTVYDGLDECIEIYRKYASEAVCNREGCPKDVWLNTLDPKKNDRQVRSSNFRVCGCKARVVFDMVADTTKYKMVFVPFTAIDKHRKSVTVGSGLLKKETAEAYGWLLRAFKKAFVRSPNIFVTDQDGAMRLDVAAEFPKSKHRLCMWNIMQKFPAKIVSRIYDDTDFKDKFGKIVWNVFIGPEEFKDRWNKLMGEFNLFNHEWLPKMYRLRPSWVPAFFVDSPLCGLMRTTSSLFIRVQKKIVAWSWLCSITGMSSDEGCTVCIIDEEKIKHVGLPEVIDKESTSENVEEKINLHQKVTGHYKPDKVKVKNSTGVRLNEREKQKRIKSGREISMKKSVIKRNKKLNGYGVCGSTSHNRRTCPRKNDVDVLYPAVAVPGGSDHVDGGL